MDTESKSFLDIFTDLESYEYVVLRNFETFMDDSTLEDHPDVDMLARHPEEIVAALHLVHRKKKDDGIHYKMKWKDREIAFDLRTIGDGYYDSAWEEKLLTNRQKLATFYVLDKEDYYYSLMYHAVVQKKDIAADYVERLKEMGQALGVVFEKEKAYDILNDYLRAKGYRYTYPKLPGTIFRLDGADRDLVEDNKEAEVKRRRYQFISKIRKIFRGK